MLSQLLELNPRLLRGQISLEKGVVMSHTPQPWMLAHSDVDEDCRIVCNDTFGCIAVLEHNPEFGIDADANGPVIAAAPDLLEACEEVLAWEAAAGSARPTPEIASRYFATMKKVVGAVAKARGEGIFKE